MQENLSKVNFKKLVRNLADMYHDDTFDVVLTELIANALDAKASKISVSWDRKQHILIVVDDGKGMDSEAFKQYHDFAAELKTRGNSIGFAGVGAKISFNIADRVVPKLDVMVWSMLRIGVGIMTDLSAGTLFNRTSRRLMAPASKFISNMTKCYQMLIPNI